GRTPLIYAAKFNHREVVAVLLKRDDVDPNWRGEDGRTALSWAAEVGTEGTVKLLLEHGASKYGTADREGKTPLNYAQMRGLGGLIQILSTGPPGSHQMEAMETRNQRISCAQQ
ncbi:ankyrin repeat-containing domain protein, partial [Tuber borchii]